VAEDDWKDGVSSEGAKEYAEYMACVSQEFMEAFQAKRILS